MRIHPATTRRPGVLAILRHPIGTLREVARRLRDPRVPALAKLLLLATVAYAVSPFDFLTDFLPLIGLADDLALATAALWWFLALSSSTPEPRPQCAARNTQ